MKLAIVGAGALGCMAALKAIELGYQVGIYERSDLSALADNAAVASAGMLAPLGEIIHAPRSVLQLGLHSLKQWPQLVKNLAALDPHKQPIFFQQKGSLVTTFANDRASFAQLSQDLTITASDFRGDIKFLEQPELAQLEPALHNFGRAYYLKTEAQLCNRSFLASSIRVVQHLGEINDRQAITEAGFRKLQAQYDWVLDCRGSGAIAQPNGIVDMPLLRGVRGEVVRIRCTDVELRRPVRIIHPRHSIYIVPKPNREFVVGATEIETASEHPITVRSALELLNTLYAVNPAFAEAQILETRVGIRPAFADNVPRIFAHGNVLSANGLYRHGWLVGPAIAEQMLARITQEQAA